MRISSITHGDGWKLVLTLLLFAAMFWLLHVVYPPYR
jgi:F0F1-type ATP synthase assembly protein I